MKTVTKNVLIIAMMLFSGIASQQLKAQLGNIIAVTPDSSVYGVTVTLIISGHNTHFTQATSCLKRPSTSDWIFGTNNLILNDSTMQSTFSIPSGLYFCGLWDVHADTVSPLVNGFTVFSNSVIIHGNVFYDDNGNCMRDTTESGAGGGTILIQPGNINCYVAPMGNYEAEVPLGFYTATISYTPPVGTVSCPVSGTLTVSVASAVPSHIYNQNFGVASVFISGHIFHDSNGNCLRDTGEQSDHHYGYILLKPANQWAYVDTSGYYSFRVPTGFYTDTVVYVNYWGNLNYNFNTCQPTHKIIVPVASNSAYAIPNQDFGMTYSTITGHIYHDINENCGRDTLEPKYHGGSVLITPGNYHGSIDTNGFYTVNVPVGFYTAHIRFIDNYVTSCPPDSVVIASNSAFTFPNNDFGVKYNLIQGHVYKDVNGNCAKDTLEPAFYFGYVSVNPGNLIASIDTNGFYSIQVPTGTYDARIKFVPSYYPYYLFVNSNCPLIDTVHIVGTSAYTITNQNLGFKFNMLHGYAYRDKNGNCVRDAGDTPIHSLYSGIYIKPYNIYANIDTSGYYSVPVASGFHTDTIILAFAGNITPCPSFDTVIIGNNSCITLPNHDIGVNYDLIEGYVYNDADGNCIHDVSETAYYSNVRVTPGNYIAGVDYSTGFYSIPVPVGNNTYTVQPYNYGSPNFTSCPATYNVTLSGTTGHDTTNNNFGITYDLIQGYIYHDLNFNCILDSATEQRFHYGYVIVNPGGLYGSVDWHGYYSIQVPTGSYFANVEYLPPVSGATTTVCPSIGSYAINMPGTTATTIPNNNFAITFDSCARIKTWTNIDERVPCHYSWSQAAVQNLSADTAKNVVLTLTLDTLLEPLYSYPAWSSHSGNSFTYTIPLIYPFSSVSATIEDSIPCGTPLGVNICNYADATSSQPACQTYNSTHASICRLTALSWDPNEKITVSPGTSYITANDELTYMINFQNTGTAPATDIVITDVLPPQLLPYTLITGMSSFPYTFTMYGTGIAKFVFHNINLPDSSANQAGSHGYVQFTIQQKPGNPIGTVINNKANIYFDYNPAVITNSTYNIIGAPLEVPSISVAKETSILVYPNPFTNTTHFVFNNKLPNDKYTLILYDVTGRVVKEVKNIISPTYDLNRDNLNSQIYFYRILNNDNTPVGTGKLIITD